MSFPDLIGESALVIEFVRLIGEADRSSYPLSNVEGHERKLMECINPKRIPHHFLEKWRNPVIRQDTETLNRSLCAKQALEINKLGCGTHQLQRVDLLFNNPLA